MEQIESQALFLAERMKRLDGVVDGFFRGAVERVEFFDGQAKAYSARRCVRNKEKLAIFEADVMGALNATLSDWSRVLGSYASFTEQIRSLKRLGSGGSVREKATRLPEDLQLATPEASVRCSFDTLSKDVNRISKVKTSVAAVRLVQFRQAYNECQELIDADVETFFKTVKTFSEMITAATPDVSDAPADLLKRSSQFAHAIEELARSTSFKVHDAFFQFGQAVDAAVERSRPTRTRCRN